MSIFIHIAIFVEMETILKRFYSLRVTLTNKILLFLIKKIYIKLQEEPIKTIKRLPDGYKEINTCFCTLLVKENKFEVKNLVFFGVWFYIRLQTSSRIN